MNRKMCRTGVIAASALLLMVYGQDAMAAIDFGKAETTGNEIVGFMRGPLATVAFAVGFAVAGLLAAFNRISWAWLGGIVLGAVLVFGGPAFVENLRSMLS